MAKRADGEGTIRQKTIVRNGKKYQYWEAIFTYTDKYGQKKRHSVYAKTQGEVVKKKTEACQAISKENYRPPERCTLNEWFNYWISNFDTDWKPRTIDSYRAKAKRHILPYFGDKQLSEITKAEVRTWVRTLSKGSGKQKPLSPKSVRDLHGLLHNILAAAVEDDKITENPVGRKKQKNLPEVTKKALSPLMDEDVTRFMKACETDRFGRLYIVAMFTGLRQSELLGLKWSDIDFKEKTIHVQRQLQKVRDKPEYIFIDTKNGKDRSVPFSKSIAETLKKEQRQQAAWKLAAGALWNNEHNLVFTTELGDHLAHSTIQNSFRKFRNSLGLKCRFHDLRHSCAILALEGGCDVKSVSDMLGHYSSAFTMDVYADVSRGMREETQSRMEAVFQRASNG